MHLGINFLVRQFCEEISQNKHKEDSEDPTCMRPPYKRTIPDVLTELHEEWKINDPYWVVQDITCPNGSVAG